MARLVFACVLCLVFPIASGLAQQYPQAPPPQTAASPPPQAPPCQAVTPTPLRGAARGAAGGAM
ncbi:MAG TPA: hypothetical protein VJR47_18865, partial [Stellaceae bacterium]|nr:hypothetical protein [Stellaceae bacterium]